MFGRSKACQFLFVLSILLRDVHFFRLRWCSILQMGFITRHSWFCRVAAGWDKWLHHHKKKSHQHKCPLRHKMMQFYSKYWRCKHLHLILPLVNTEYWTATFWTCIRHTSTPKKSPQITSPTAREALYYSNLHSEICWTAEWWNCDTTHSCTPRARATNTFGKIGIMQSVHSIWCYLNHFWLFCAPKPKFKVQFLQDKVEHAKPIVPPKTRNLLESCTMNWLLFLLPWWLWVTYQ